MRKRRRDCCARVGEPEGGERGRERLEPDVREGLSCVGASNLIVTVPEGVFKGWHGG